DPFARDRIDARGFSDEERAPDRDGAAPHVAPLRVALALVTRRIEPAALELGAEDVVDFDGGAAERLQPIHAAAHERPSLDDGRKIPVVTREARTREVEQDDPAVEIRVHWLRVHFERLSAVGFHAEA